jgi:hypothetical protein
MNSHVEMSNASPGVPPVARTAASSVSATAPRFREGSRT